jgi:hypothetical protein
MPSAKPSKSQNRTEFRLYFSNSFFGQQNVIVQLYLAIVPAHINASSAVCVMFQCFPAHIISTFKPIVALKHRCNVQSNSSFVCETYFVFTNGLIET